MCGVDAVAAAIPWCSMPLVTILMPAFNAAAHLQEALDSLFAQSLGDFELLVVDDGSEDDTPAILAGQKDRRLRVLRNERRLKLSGALNRGLDEARGEFIARMDADDLARPRRLERQAAFLQSRQSVALCGTWVWRFGGPRAGVLCYPASPEEVRAFSLFHCPFAHPTVMMRRAVMDAGAFRYDGSFYPTEDYELWARVLDAHNGANIGRVLLDYREHAASMTGADWGSMDEQAVRVLRGRLARLGMTASDGEARFHRDVAMGRVPPGEEGLALAEAWLSRLADANEASGLCERRALARVEYDMWFRACMANASAGLACARRFAASPLSRAKRSRLADAAILSAAVAKARARGLRP
jgi:hypothetical protein